MKKSILIILILLLSSGYSLERSNTDTDLFFTYGLNYSNVKGLSCPLGVILSSDYNITGSGYYARGYLLEIEPGMRTQQISFGITAMGAETINNDKQRPMPKVINRSVGTTYKLGILHDNNNISYVGFEYELGIWLRFTVGLFVSENKDSLYLLSLGL